MVNFEVKLNGEIMSVAGLQSTYGVLSVIVMSTRRVGQEEELTIDVGGLNSETKEHVRWINQNLSVGDEISVRVMEGGPKTAPTTTITREEMETRDREYRLKMFNDLKEEFKNLL